MLLASSLTVNSNGGWAFWASVATVVLAVLGIAGYVYRYMIRPAWRAASTAYHDDIRETVATQLMPIVAELSPNHGTSMKDHLTSLVATVGQIRGEVADLAAAVQAHVTDKTQHGGLS